jgi:hypothetical protein
MTSKSSHEWHGRGSTPRPLALDRGENIHCAARQMGHASRVMVQLQLFSEQNRRVSFQRKVLDGRGNVVEVNPIEDLSGSDPGYMMPTTRLAALR